MLTNWGHFTEDSSPEYLANYLYLCQKLEIAHLMMRFSSHAICQLAIRKPANYYQNRSTLITRNEWNVQFQKYWTIYCQVLCFEDGQMRWGLTFKTKHSKFQTFLVPTLPIRKISSNQAILSEIQSPNSLLNHPSSIKPATSTPNLPSSPCKTLIHPINTRVLPVYPGKFGFKNADRVKVISVSSLSLHGNLRHSYFILFLLQISTRNMMWSREIPSDKDVEWLALISLAHHLSFIVWFDICDIF